MSSTSQPSAHQPSATQKQDPNGLPLRRLLAGLALLTLMATFGKVVGLSAPMPSTEAPSSLRMAGYHISTLPTAAPQWGRDLSRGTTRQFRLVPLSGEPMLTLTLLPVRSRTGTKLSETTLGGKDLGMEAVGTLVPGFAMQDQRLVFQPVSKAGGSTPQADQLALGRGAADPAGSTTRLQTCLTSSGHAAFNGYLLRPMLAAGMTENRWSPNRLLRLIGLQQARYECLAVQLESGTFADGKGGKGSVDRQRQLETVWKDLRGVLVKL
ncbi:MAG: hypothetical protein ACK535_11730 [Cyanobacteriota bacterium]